MNEPIAKKVSDTEYVYSQAMSLDFDVAQKARLETNLAGLMTMKDQFPDSQQLAIQIDKVQIQIAKVTARITAARAVGVRTSDEVIA